MLRDDHRGQRRADHAPARADDHVHRGRDSGLLLRGRDDDHVDAAHHGEGHARAHDHDPHDDLVLCHVVLVEEHVADDRQHHAEDHRPLRTRLLDYQPGDGPEDERDRGHGQHQQPGLERVQPEVEAGDGHDRLVRREHGEADHEAHDRRDGDVALLHQAGAHERLLGLGLPPGEREDEGGSGHQQAGHQRVGPAPVAGLRHADEEGHQACAQQGCAEEVDPHLEPHGGLLDLPRDQDREEDRERDHGVIGPLPAPRLGDVAADDEPDGGPDAEHGRDDTLGDRQLVPRELVPDDGERQREHGHAQALEGPEADHDVDGIGYLAREARERDRDAVDRPWR